MKEKEKLDKAKALLDSITLGSALSSNDPVTSTLLEAVKLLAEQIDAIPFWVWEHKCCAPGETCCYCD